MKTFGLFLLPGSAVQKEEIGAVLKALSAPGTKILRRVTDGIDLPGIAAVSEAEFWKSADCVLSLGGDGTILAAAPKASRSGTPVFGVNLGHVGFLTACGPFETEKLRRLLTGEVFPSRRMMLSLRVNGRLRDVALNEILLAPRDRGKLLAGSICANGSFLTEFRADSLLFHTSTGSTGYAFSAGGAVCGEEMRLIGVKAVSPYLRRGGHQMLFGEDAVFTPTDLSCRGGPPEAVADGRRPVPLKEGDRVEIARAEKDLTLLFAEPHDNQAIFCEKIREAGRERP
ncbi:MAG: NAD(+)/NADH kinase [Clostridia bacterium]|nr:NAD(+)/NADH kinase [Clostridia bacterium]